MVENNQNKKKKNKFQSFIDFKNHIFKQKNYENKLNDEKEIKVKSSKCIDLDTKLGKFIKIF